MKTALVTGGRGFLGRRVVGRLQALGFRVVGTTRRSETTGDPCLRTCDLFDPRATRRLVESVQPSHVLHLAWYTEHGRFWRSRDNLDWVAGSAALFRSAVDCGAERIVAAGTCAEYDWSHPHCREATTPTVPHTLYGVCKDATRRVLQKTCEEAGVEWAWGRLFFPYGSGEPSQKLVSSIAGSLLAGDPVACRSGNHVRDFIHVDDAAEAFAAVVASQLDGCVNVCSGRGTRLGEIAATVAALVGRPDLLGIESQPGRSDNPEVLVGDSGRLREELGWRPQVSLEDGLREVVAAQRSRLGSTFEAA